ncbi:MAG: VWA domain-containing protein, partial [Candidatus Dormibacteria bacterium]
MSRQRFSSWDGTQEPLGPDTDEVFDRLSEDVFQGWDFDSALRRLLSQGWRNPEGRQLIGLEKMTEELRRRRRRQLEKHSLDGIFDDIEEKLNRVLRLERTGIAERLESAGDGAGRRVLEKVAEKRRHQLDELPEQPAGTIRALQDYEFIDRRAEQAFQGLMEELKRSVVDAHLQQVTEQLGSMSAQDLSRLREMIHDLNALIRRRLEGVSPAQVQTGYEAFLRRWGSMFPGAPATFEEFLEHLERQMARMQSLLQSLSPEMRRELDDLVNASLRDPELNAEMAELAASLELLSPRSSLGSRYSFHGDEQLSLEEAMSVMAGLQSMEELERAISGVYRGGEVDAATQEALTSALGEEMTRSLRHLQEMTRELERRGVVERGDRGLHLTARGMRRIGQKALNDLFSRLKRDRFGDHALSREGRGGERSDQSRPYEFGDAFDLDVQQTVMNAMRREAGDPDGRPTGGGGLAAPRLAAEDFDVHGTESMTRASTVLMLDMSRSMPLRGYFYAAKKVALALDALIRSQYPRDSLHIIGFARSGQEISSGALPGLSVDEYVYGTNLQHALMMARRILSRHKGGARQVIIVTDGEP